MDLQQIHPGGQTMQGPDNARAPETSQKRSTSTSNLAERDREILLRPFSQPGF